MTGEQVTSVGNPSEADPRTGRPAQKSRKAGLTAIAFNDITDPLLKGIFQFCDPIQDRRAVSLTCKQFDSAFKNIEFGDWLNIFSKHKQNEIFTKLLTTIEANEQFKIKVESYLESYMTRLEALYLGEHHIARLPNAKHCGLHYQQI